jgi:hypothetical protein
MSGELSPEEIDRHDAICQSLVRALHAHDTTVDEALMALVSVTARFCTIAPNPEAVCLVVVGDLVDEFKAEKRRWASEQHVTIPAPPET